MARKRRKSSSARKAWRFIKKHRRRRARLHPTRRRQENLAILGGVASVILIIFIGPWAAALTGTASVMAGVASQASAPKNTQRRGRKPKNLVEGGGQFFGRFTHKQAIKLKQKSQTCSDACKYSTHPSNTCDCICNGAQHGIWAWGPAKGKTTPNTPRPRKRTTRKTKTRKQVRS